jgi:hypothetical protein
MSMIAVTFLMYELSYAQRAEAYRKGAELRLLRRAEKTLKVDLERCIDTGRMPMTSCSFLPQNANSPHY